MLKKKKNNRGFTLVELLVVIAIIGILAVVALPALFSNINKAKIADLEADYSAFKSAALSYYSDNNNFTSVAEVAATGTTIGTITESQGKETENNTAIGEYMESVPANSPFNTPYKMVELDGSLILTCKAPSSGLSAKEVSKLEKDLGENSVYVQKTSDEKVAGGTLIKLVVTKTN